MNKNGLRALCALWNCGTLMLMTLSVHAQCLELVCPANLLLTMPCGSNCVPVIYPPFFATNDCSPGDLTVSNTLPSGTCFGLGTTPVTVTVSGSSQSTNCTFFVTVLTNNCPTSNSCSCATSNLAGGTVFTLLHELTHRSDGTSPWGGLLLSGTNLYGTMSSGGDSNCGTVFVLNTNGTGFTVLHSFTGGSDGSRPFAGLTLSGTTLYGTTSSGGSSNCGTVFALNTDATGFTVLHTFTGGSDGSAPYAGLVLSATNLYGAATAGGSSGYGTVFALGTNGTGYTVLHAFTGGSDGGNPYAGLALSATNLYGATFRGGIGAGYAGYGTVFALNPDGTGFTVLHAFTGGDDGANPRSGLFLAGASLYGTVPSGGSLGYGTVFALNTDGTGYTVLHAFTGGSDGAHPEANLILSATTLYGTAAAGGSSDFGTVFALSTNTPGEFTVLYNFTDGSDGGYPETGLIWAGTTLYGAAQSGGNDNAGTVFALTFTNFTTNCLQVLSPGDLLATSCTNLQAFYAPTVTDLACTNWTVICTPPSGSFFAPNTTNLVTCAVTDGCGNSNACTFTVTVLPGTNCCCPVSIRNGVPGTVVLTWPCGVLQSSTTANGSVPYTDVPGATSPHTTSLVNAPPRVFYRTRCN